MHLSCIPPHTGVNYGRYRENAINQRSEMISFLAYRTAASVPSDAPIVFALLSITASSLSLLLPKAEVICARRMSDLDFISLYFPVLNI